MNFAIFTIRLIIFEHIVDRLFVWSNKVDGMMFEGLPNHLKPFHKYDFVVYELGHGKEIGDDGC